MDHYESSEFVRVQERARKLKRNVLRCRRMVKSAEDQELFLAKERERQQKVRQSVTPEQKEIAKPRNTARRAAARCKLSAQETSERKAKATIQRAASRAAKTPECKATARLRRNRAADQKRHDRRKSAGLQEFCAVKGCSLCVPLRTLAEREADAERLRQLEEKGKVAYAEYQADWRKMLEQLLIDDPVEYWRGVDRLHNRTSDPVFISEVMCGMPTTRDQ